MPTDHATTTHWSNEVQFPVDWAIELSGISDVLESFYNSNALVAKKTLQVFNDPEIDCEKLLRYGKSADFQALPPEWKL